MHHRQLSEPTWRPKPQQRFLRSDCILKRKKKEKLIRKSNNTVHRLFESIPGERNNKNKSDRFTTAAPGRRRSWNSDRSEWTTAHQKVLVAGRDGTGVGGRLAVGAVDGRDEFQLFQHGQQDTCRPSPQDQTHLKSIGGGAVLVLLLLLLTGFLAT